MKVYTGTDITEVIRIKKAIETTKQVFLNRVFTEKEQEYCNSRKAHMYESYAARFAVKEAVSKALGTGIGKNADFLSIEVINNDSGKPICVLYGTVLELYNNLNICSMDISITHTSDIATAFVVMISE